MSGWRRTALFNGVLGALIVLAVADLGHLEESVLTATVVMAWSAVSVEDRRWTWWKVPIGLALTGALVAVLYVSDGWDPAFFAVFLILMEAWAYRPADAPSRTSTWWERTGGPSKNPADYR